jgi:ABC-2 type transport system ATP-binding protein
VKILLIGKGKILLDGSLDELKMRDSAVKKLVVRYSSGSFETTDGITLIRENSGEVVFGVDTLKIYVSKAIEQITRKAEITDLEVMGSTAEELVVSLYRDFGI